MPVPDPLLLPAARLLAEPAPGEIIDQIGRAHV